MVVRSPPIHVVRLSQLSRWFLCALLVPLALGDAQSGAQVVRVVGAGASQGSGFSVRKEDPAVADALSEFDRYVGKSEWEKAFAALAKVVDAKQSKGLIDVGDGFYKPTRKRLREVLAALPPAGKQAYRLFFDAKAQQAFAQAVAPAPSSNKLRSISTPTNESLRLQDLFDQYLITSIGDQIGDRLGDTLFETGDFSGAARAWSTILRDYPDTSLPVVRLRTKRAIALARAGRHDEFLQAIDEIRQKHAGQTTRIAGRDVEVVGMLEEIAAQAQAPALSLTQPPVASAPISLPATDEPLWQCAFADDTFLREMGSAANNMMNRWDYSGNPANLGPSAVADSRRVYLSWFGVAFAIDVESGKLLWRTGPFSDVSTKLQNGMRNGMTYDADTIVMSPRGDSLLVVRQTAATSRRSSQQPASEMACLSAVDGKQIWTSAGSLATWTLAGDPLIDGDTVYIAGRRNTTQLSLLAISLPDGKLQWEVTLGEGTATQDYRGVMKTSTPIIRTRGGMIYVSPSNGALLAIDATARRIEWAYVFGKPQPAQGNVVYYYNRGREAPKFPASMAFADSSLFVKDKDDDTLYALDLSGPTLMWKRPVDANATIACVDERASTLCVLAEELNSIDLKTRDLRWSTKTPVDNGGTEPLLVGGHLYLFGSRGVYDIDTRTGDRTIFRGLDRDSTGSSIHHVGQALICVSNRSVTAYALPPR